MPPPFAPLSYATVSVLQISPAVAADLAPSVLIASLASAALGGGAPDANSDQVEVTIEMTSNVEIALPFNVSAAQMALALETSLCDKFAPGECTVQESEAGERRALRGHDDALSDARRPRRKRSGSASFDVGQRVNDSANVTFDAPPIDTGALAADLGVSASALGNVTNTLASVNAEVTVVSVVYVFA